MIKMLGSNNAKIEQTTDKYEKLGKPRIDIKIEHSTK